MSEPNLYRCVRVADGLPLLLDPRSEQWREAEAATIASYGWGQTGPFPGTTFRATWDSESVSVLFEVQDQWVRCLETEPGGAVWQDACVEFFFSTGQGYFNVEANCGGTLLVAWQTARDQGRRPLRPEQILAVPVLASAPRVIDPEITDPFQWSLALRIPWVVLSEIHQLAPPEIGTIWRSNFYKCAENNSRPHWGSWSPIGTPRPDFHRPEFFGRMVFGG